MLRSNLDFPISIFLNLACNVLKKGLFSKSFLLCSWIFWSAIIPKRVDFPVQIVHKNRLSWAFQAHHEHVQDRMFIRMTVLDKICHFFFFFEKKTRLKILWDPWPRNCMSMYGSLCVSMSLYWSLWVSMNLYGSL